MPLFEIDTISIFKHKYVIEADSLDKAANAIHKKTPEELTQVHVSENIIEDKVIEKKDFDDLIKKLNKNNEVFSNAHLEEKIIFKA